MRERANHYDPSVRAEVDEASAKRERAKRERAARLKASSLEAGVDLSALRPGDARAVVSAFQVDADAAELDASGDPLGRCMGRVSGVTWAETAIGEARAVLHHCDREWCPCCGRTGSGAHQRRADRAIAQLGGARTRLHVVLSTPDTWERTTDPRVVGVLPARNLLRVLLRAAYRWTRAMWPMHEGWSARIRLHVASKRGHRWRPHVHVMIGHPVELDPWIARSEWDGWLASAGMDWARRVRAGMQAWHDESGVEWTEPDDTPDAWVVYRKPVSADAWASTLRYQVGPRARWIDDVAEWNQAGRLVAAALVGLNPSRWYGLPIPPEVEPAESLSPFGLPWGEPAKPSEATMGMWRAATAKGKRTDGWTRASIGTFVRVPDPIRWAEWVAKGRPCVPGPSMVHLSEQSRPRRADAPGNASEQPGKPSESQRSAPKAEWAGTWHAKIRGLDDRDDYSGDDEAGCGCGGDGCPDCRAYVDRLDGYLTRSIR